MSIKIHWGPPGSFKTSGAVTDDFITAARAGRHIVTNVRGLDDEKHIRKVLNLPDDNTFSLCYLDTEGSEASINADKIAKFFHWMPYGAFFLCDEAPKFFPKAWRPKDLKELDFVEPDGTVGRIGCRDAEGNERPHNLISAFQQHRHYGWDIVMTSTNITNFRHDIRANAEGAFKHRNMALIGFKGLYNEAFHSAESGGRQSDFLSIQTKKIPKITWDLYKSTATGTFTDTIAGKSLFKDPKIMLLGGIFVFLVVFLSTRSLPSALGGKKPETANSSVPANPQTSLAVVSSAITPSKTSVVTPVNVAPVVRSNNSLNLPSAYNSGASLKGYNLKIVGSFGRDGSLKYLIQASNDKMTFHFNSSEFPNFGFKFSVSNKCLIYATSLDNTLTVPISCNANTSSSVLASN